MDTPICGPGGRPIPGIEPDRQPSNTIGPVLRCRLAVQEMIENFQPNVFITLAFNQDTSLNAAHSALKEFHKRFDKKVLGHKYSFDPKCRSFYIGVIENPTSNLHFHLVLKIPVNRLGVARDLTDRLWRGVISSGTTAFKETYDLPGLGRYMAKQLMTTTSDMLIFSDVGIIEQTT